jgi:hypothetical protein
MGPRRRLHRLRRNNENLQQNLDNEINLYNQSQQKLANYVNLYNQSQQNLDNETNLYNQSQQNLVNETNLYNQSQQNLVNETNLYNQSQQNLANETNLYNTEVNANKTLNKMIDDLQHNHLQNYDEMYENVKKQNEILKKQIGEKGIYMTVDDKLSYYQSQQVDTLKTVNRILYYLYQLLIFATIVILVFFNKKWSLFPKVGIIILFILYPFFIGYLEKMIFFILSYLYNVLIGEAYSRDLQKNPMYGNRLY